MEPSKSGVIGLVCAALGRDRAAPIDDLAAVRMGVRVDREGLLGVDYQTAQGVVKADAAPGRRAADRPASDLENSQSWRYFLANAVFLVGLEGHRALLEGIYSALERPCWPLYLGRKSYIPSVPPLLKGGLVEKSLEQALAEHPSLVGSRGDETAPIRYVLEVGDGARRADQPTAPFAERRFGNRYVQIISCARGEVPGVSV